MLYWELNTVGGYLSPACGGGKITSTHFFLIDKGILQWCAKGIVIFCFSQSSQKLHERFIGTELYKKHLKSFVEKKGMLMKTKISILTTVTRLMGFGVFTMARKEIWIPCIIIGVVLLCHIMYFVFGIKMLKEEKTVQKLFEKAVHSWTAFFHGHLEI